MNSARVNRELKNLLVNDGAGSRPTPINFDQNRTSLPSDLSTSFHKSKTSESFTTSKESTSYHKYSDSDFNIIINKINLKKAIEENLCCKK